MIDLRVDKLSVARVRCSEYLYACEALSGLLLTGRVRRLILSSLLISASERSERSLASYCSYVATSYVARAPSYT